MSNNFSEAADLVTSRAGYKPKCMGTCFSSEDQLVDRVVIEHSIYGDMYEEHFNFFLRNTQERGRRGRLA